MIYWWLTAGVSFLHSFCLDGPGRLFMLLPTVRNRPKRFGPLLTLAGEHSGWWHLDYPNPPMRTWSDWLHGYLKPLLLLLPQCIASVGREEIIGRGEKGMEHDEEEELPSPSSSLGYLMLCRICHEEEDGGRATMESPCGCSGSLKVHI